MDPRFWEELKKNMEAALRESGKQGVRLRGGPMDGALVGEDAACFRQDWYLYLPASAVENFDPGYYERDPDDESGARWVTR